MNQKTLLLFVIFGMIVSPLGCSFSTGAPATPTHTDEMGTVPAAATVSENAPTHESLQTGGIPVSYENVVFLIPGGVAGGAATETMPSVESNGGAPWDIAPAHLRFTLKNYSLQETFHVPRIFVYPAEEYAQANEIAAEQIDRLKKILAGAPPLEETLPTVPFFNAAGQIAADISILPFQNGSGVRFLTQYAQYAAPINNHELFYHFQGLTRDNRYYVIAILPVSAPILAENEKPEAAIPEGGVPIPAGIGPNDVYYFSVTKTLNALSPDEFTPALPALDALIQSMTINP